MVEVDSFIETSNRELSLDRLMGVSIYLTDSNMSPAQYIDILIKQKHD